MRIGCTQGAWEPAAGDSWLAGGRRRAARAFVAGLAGAAAAIALVACGSTASSTGGGHPAPGTPVVMTRNLAGLGTVLVNTAGKTIYSPEQEAHGKILCTGNCLSFWF